MANFGDYLSKYGVPFVSKPLSYKSQVWPNRNGQKLTGGVFHTEGIGSKISGKADRSLFAAFDGMLSKPASQRANTHGFFAFSGLLELYLDIEQGCWGAGNDNDNVQRIQFETQDNGYYDDPNTYTSAQYRSWAGTLCAVRDWSKEHQNIDIPFQYGKNGWDRHHTISTGRTCPAALDTDRIFREADALYKQVNNPPPAIPDWKKNAQDVGDKTFKTQKDVSLINFQSGQSVQIVKAGTDVTVRYLTGGYYLTKSSFDSDRPTGFKKEDLEYTIPTPPATDWKVEYDKLKIDFDEKVLLLENADQLLSKLDIEHNDLKGKYQELEQSYKKLGTSEEAWKGLAEEQGKAIEESKTTIKELNGKILELQAENKKLIENAMQAAIEKIKDALKRILERFNKK